MAQTVAITGTSRGLGEALSAGFQAAGWNVAGCSRSTGVDVSDEGSVQNWAQDVLARWGAPDLVLNNAATINCNAPLWEVPPDEFRQLLSVNLQGTFHVIRAFVPAMIARGSGVLVNFSSTWGRTTSPEVAPYCCTKWGIEGLTRALAQELPPGLAAVAFNPGVIDTDMLRSCFGDSAGAYPSAAEWATRAVPFLARLSAKDNGKSLSLS